VRGIFLVFEGGPGGFYEAVQVVSFNLSWLLNGRDSGLGLRRGRERPSRYRRRDNGTGLNGIFTPLEVWKSGRDAPYPCFENSTGLPNPPAPCFLSSDFSTLSLFAREDPETQRWEGENGLVSSWCETMMRLISL